MLGLKLNPVSKRRPTLKNITHLLLQLLLDENDHVVTKYTFHHYNNSNNYDNDDDLMPTVIIITMIEINNNYNHIAIICVITIVLLGKSILSMTTNGTWIYIDCRN